MELPIRFQNGYVSNIYPHKTQLLRQHRNAPS